jgi:hypothetical protein
VNKIKALILAGALILTLGACASGTNGVGSSVSPYVVEVAELDPTVFPADYPQISSSDFDAASDKLMSANSSSEVKTYQDVVDIFGVDGAYYQSNDFDDNGTTYKYYGWYGDGGENLLVTFKADGNKLDFYAYTVG